MTENENVEVIAVEKNVKEKKIKIIVSVVLVLAFIGLIIYKGQTPDFPLITVFIIIGVLVTIGLVVFFGAAAFKRLSHLKDKTDEDDIKVPKAAMPEVIENKINQIVLQRRNHIKEVISIEPDTIGKNSICSYKLKLLYTDDALKIDEIYVIVNANFLDDKPPAIDAGNISISRLNRLKNGLSNAPSSMPDIEETIEENPLLGTSKKVKKTIHKPKKTSDKKKSEEDVA